MLEQPFAPTLHASSSTKSFTSPVRNKIFPGDLFESLVQFELLEILDAGRKSDQA